MTPELPGPWAADAACKSLPAGHMFVEDLIVSAPRRKTQQLIEERRAICEGCPVKMECRTWAMGVPDPAVTGIAGGLSWWERRQIRLGRSVAA